MHRNLLLIAILIFTISFSCTKNELKQERLEYSLFTESWPEPSFGSITPSEGMFEPNSILTLYARPEPGRIFSHWEGSVNGFKNPVLKNVDDNLLIRAVFVHDTFKIRTMAGGTEVGSSLSQLDYPTGIAFGATGDLYVSDMNNHRVQLWRKGATFGTVSAGGNFLGNNTNQLYQPGKIDIDFQSNLYIADTGNNRIQMWPYNTSDGHTVAGGNGAGAMMNQLDKPYAISLDNYGFIYISELGNHRVIKWKIGAEEGEVVAGDNGEGNEANQLAFPLGIAVSSQGDLYVADTYNHRIQLWKKGENIGKTIISGKDFELDEQITYFSDVLIESDSLLYITDYFNKRILRYNLNSNSHDIIFSNDFIYRDEDKLSQPYQTIVDELGNLVVVDAYNNRVQKFKMYE